MSPSNIAMADWFHPPEIKEIDLSAWTGQAGQSIRIQANGGEVFTYAREKEIIVEGGKTRGLLMEDGTRIEAPCVISSAGVMDTFQRLLPEAAGTLGQATADEE